MTNKCTSNLIFHGKNDKQDNSLFDLYYIILIKPYLILKLGRAHFIVFQLPLRYEVIGVEINLID